MRSSNAAKLPHAIVIGLDSITGLQTARILASNGVPVIAIAKHRDHRFCRTRACEKIVFADTTNDELIVTLAALGPGLEQKAVLFPCSDQSVLLISRWRRHLEPWFHVMLPEPQIVEMLIDKAGFYTYARETGLPIPRTFVVECLEHVERAADELTFPCIMKPPRRTLAWEQHTSSKVLKITNASELLHSYRRYSPWAPSLMLQEWVEGTDADLYSCNCYFSRDSKPLVTFVSRKLRQWPPEIGVSSLGEECRNDVVLNQSVRLFQSVGYRGLGYVEMKRDSRSGQQFIIEPNIGRPTGRSAIAEAGGVPLLYAAYCDTVGKPLPPGLEQKYRGAKWVYIQRDVQSALHYWRRGDLTLKQWAASWRGRKVDAVISWKDPGPFLGELKRALSLLAGRISSRKSSSAVSNPNEAVQLIR